MRIIIAGATGFVGSALVQRLLGDGHKMLVIRRPGSKSRPLPSADAPSIELDPSEPITGSVLAGDAIINLVGIIREFPWKGVTFHKAHYLVTKNLIDYAVKHGIGRFLQMSALGVGPGSRTGYQRTKYLAEQYLRESGLEWTIFKPSVIFGPGDHLVTMFAGMIKSLPVIPVVGEGTAKLQPVHVDDVCAGFRKAITDLHTIGMTFEFGGPEILTYDQMLDVIGDVVGVRRVRKLHQPIWLMNAMASVFGWLPFFPITRDQIVMLEEGNFVSEDSYFKFFGITGRKFREGVAEYLK